MFLQTLLLFLSICSIKCQITKKATLEDVIERRMMGIDAVRGADIDKDTIITRNLKLDTKNRAKKERENEPDWSYDEIPLDVSSDVDTFKKNMTECLREVQGNDKRPVQRLSPGKESPVHAECLIACILKRNGVIENRKVNKANLITLVRKFYAKDTRMMKKLEKNLDRCVEASAHARDDCSLAAQLNDCTNGLMASNKHKITINY